MTVQPTIVLVHGARADGSCWGAVIERLQASGYDVTAPRFPESSLAADVERLRQVLDRQDGPVIVAGHSKLVGPYDPAVIRCPVTPGTGPRLFPAGAPAGKWALAASRAYGNGVLHAEYRA